MRQPTFLLLAATVLVCSTPAQGADTWLRLETPHFELTGNVDESELRRVALKFESFRNVIEQVLGNTSPAQRLPRVFVFKDRGSYKPYLPVVDGKPVEVGGYFRPGHARPYITLAVTPWANDPYKVVFHEYVHLVNSKAHGPSWFSEGYAEFLAGCVIDGEKVGLGRPDLSHIQTLRTRTPFPLLTLMSMPVPAHDQQAQRLFYAQSWSLVHYLMTERSQGREQMVRFLNAEATEAAFRQAFGTSSAEMAKEIQRYLEGGTMGYYKIPIAKAGLPRDLKPRRISGAEAEALLADLVAQHPGREGEGRQRLERLLQQEPALLVARDALADLDGPPTLFRSGHGVTDGAEPAGMADELSGLASRVSQVLVSDEPPAASLSAELEGALRAYTEHSPNNPEGFILLARLRGKLGAGREEILGLLERAVAAQPADISPRLALAQVQRAHGDIEAARRVLKEGIALADNPTLKAAYAREVEALAPLHGARGFLVNLKCDPSGRLDFVVQREDGQRLILRAASPQAFTVFRGGRSVHESLSCGPQRRSVVVNYKDLKVLETQIDGELTTLNIEGL